MARWPSRRRLASSQCCNICWSHAGLDLGGKQYIRDHLLKLLSIRLAAALDQAHTVPGKLCSMAAKWETQNYKAVHEGLPHSLYPVMRAHLSRTGKSPSQQLSACLAVCTAAEGRAGSWTAPPFLLATAAAAIRHAIARDPTKSKQHVGPPSELLQYSEDRATTSRSKVSFKLPCFSSQMQQSPSAGPSRAADPSCPRNKAGAPPAAAGASVSSIWSGAPWTCGL